MARLPAPEAVDARILAIATDHVRRFGARRTTVVGIADEAGMSHANVYRHFRSKQFLLDAVTSHWLRPIEAGMRDIADGPDPAYDKMERLVTGLYRAYRDKLEQDAVLFGLFSDATGQGRSVARRHRNVVQGLVQRVIEEGMAGGSFVQSDLRRAIALVFDGLHRFIYPVSVQIDGAVARVQVDARMERLVHIVLEALQRGRVR